MHRLRARTAAVFFVALAVVSGGGVWAEDAARQDYSNRVAVSVGGGIGKYFGADLDHADFGPMIHGGVRWGFTRRWDVDASLGYGTFDAKNLQPSARVLRNQSTQLDLNFIYSHRPEAKWTPQFFAGAGVLFWQVVDFTGQPSTGFLGDGPTPRGFENDGTRELLTNTNFMLGAGIGSELRLTERASIRVGGRFEALLGQDIDNTGASSAFELESATGAQHVDDNDYLVSGFVVLTWFFSNRDSDQDGIANKQDGCPYEAEDIDGKDDADGCPDPDNDGDGVADVADGCANEAEDKDGFEDEDGCPDPDNDADQVADAADRCPNEAEDADGFEDADGCPDPDNDRDGVADAGDQCTDTPQGVRVDSLGCPTARALDSERVLEGVHFEPNRDALIATSMAALDSIAESLQAHPQTEIEVHVHTSSVGPPDRNLQLSQQRAEAVMRYLTGRGVASRRVTPIGFGETQPLVRGETPDANARNERVVIAPIEAIPAPDVAPE